MLTHLGEGERRYIRCYDSHHRAVAAQVQALLAQDGTEEGSTATWQTAVSLWMGALREEYEALAAGRPQAEKDVIYKERDSYLSWLDSYQSALSARLAGQEALILKEAAYQLMNRTIQLGSERATAPSERSDSIIYGNFERLNTASPAGSACARTVLEADANADICTEVLCTSHRVLESVVLMLVERADTSELLAAGFDTGRQMWQTELDAITARLISSADEPKASAFTSEQASYRTWLEDRSQLLELLYPERKDIVAEVLEETVRSHVLDMCLIN